MTNPKKISTTTKRQNPVSLTLRSLLTSYVWVILLMISCQETKKPEASKKAPEVEKPNIVIMQSHDIQYDAM